MNRSLIVIISFAIATVIMILKEIIVNRIVVHMYKKMAKRIAEVQKRISEGEDIPSIIIDLDKESNRMKSGKNGNGLIIDGKLYTDKNSCFMQKDGRIYIVGNKEDFVITLVGKNIT